MHFEFSNYYLAFLYGKSLRELMSCDCQCPDSLTGSGNGTEIFLNFALQIHYVPHSIDFL
jgi:hypothetical protein